MCSNAMMIKRSDDFKEVRTEIVTRIRDKISALLRALAKRTSGMLSGKISKWLLECASSVSRGKIEKAKIKLTKIQIFVKENKVKLGIGAVALASAITSIGVLLHNRALLHEKMKSGLLSIVRKSKNAFAKRNKELGGRPSKRESGPMIFGGKSLLGGATKSAMSKKVQKAIEDINRKKIWVLNIIRIANEPSAKEKGLLKLKSALSDVQKDSETKRLSLEDPGFGSAVGGILMNTMLKKQSELMKLYKKANETINNKLNSLKDCLPSIRRHNDVLEGVRDKISQMLRALAKKCSSLASGKISNVLLECASLVSAGKLEKARSKFDKLIVYIKNNKERSAAFGAIALVTTTPAVIISKMMSNAMKAKEARLFKLKFAVEKSRNRLENIGTSWKTGHLPFLPSLGGLDKESKFVRSFIKILTGRGGGKRTGMELEELMKSGKLASKATSHLTGEDRQNALREIWKSRNRTK